MTAEAGVNGEVLERALNERGLMLPHYPASVDLATVGGYVAARGSGVLSTRYGKIEDLVLSLRVALAGRDRDRDRRRPQARGRARADAALRRLRGHARRRHPRDPPARAPAGGAPLRGGLVRDRCPRGSPRCAPSSPAACAPPSCACTTRWPPARRSGPSSSRSWRASARSSASRASPPSPTRRRRRCSRSPASAAPSSSTAALGETWWKRRYEFYKPPHHPQLPAIWGTIEAVAPYARIYDVYRAVKEAVEAPYAEHGLALKVHFSHWYPWGTMMYGRFIVPDGGPEAIDLHDRIWDGRRARHARRRRRHERPPRRRAEARAVHASPARGRSRRPAPDQGGARPEPDHEPGQARSL